MVTFNTYDIVKLCTVKMSLRCLRGNDLGSPLEDLIGILNLHLKLRFRYTFEVVTPDLYCENVYVLNYLNSCINFATKFSTFTMKSSSTSARKAQKIC